MYASLVWSPYLIKDIQLLERIQRRVTNYMYILNEYVSDYKTHLISLNLLPLMMTLELNDILLLSKNYMYQHTKDCFDIKTQFKFSSAYTRSGSSNKLSLSQHNLLFHNPFLDKFPRLWNALPPFRVITFPQFS